ncbi:MAG: ADP-forming succinate--CoA ligase subunit beta [Chthonomonadales bacterium]|nr:ADP-forming succinate--CoA ligase subunit beta [Chthonomonadales bacterium]
MKLHEYQAKEMLARQGVPVPRSGGTATTPEEARAAAERLGGRAVLKAQVHVGGRGKGGGIRIAESPDHAASLASEMLGMLLKTAQAPQGVRVERLLAEEPIKIARELYLGILPDRASQRNVLILSAMGGMDIEAVAEEHPQAIARAVIDPALGLRDYQVRQLCFEAGLPADTLRQAVPLLPRLFDAFIRADASLLEVNPLAVTADGRLLAADAKVTVDDNALYRHPELEAYKEESEDDPIEAEAHRRGIQYVRLGGHIGVIGNGAGLVMATLDEVARAGGRAADFLDIGGGARADLVRNALEIVLMDPNVRGVLFNIFGGITRGDEVARGVLAATEQMDIRVPMVVRLAGTRAAEGAEMLRATNLVPAATMQEAAARIVELAA